MDTLIEIEELLFADGSTVAVGLPPVLSVSPAAGDEDQPISLDMATSFVDDIGEFASVTITGIPAGAVLFSGNDEIVIDFSNADSGVVTLTPDQLANLTITPPQDPGADFALQVTAQSIVGLNSVTQSLTIDVSLVADAPVINVSSTTIGMETSNTVQFDMSTATNDASEYITSVEVSGVPDGGKLFVLTTDGTKVQIPVIDGTASIPVTLVGTVIVQIPDGYDTDFDLEVTSTSTESSGGDTASTSITVHVDLSDGSGVVGTDSADSIIGDTSSEVVYGPDGDDIIVGGGGEDTLYAGGGDDTVTGGAEIDTIHGDAGSDTLNGLAGDDVIYGGSGSDTIDGGEGADQIIGGTGDDTLTGGDGADTFIFDADSGADIISDIMQNDSIVFDGQEFHAEDMIFTENEDGDVEIAFSGVPDTKVTLEGVKTSDLDHNGDGDLSDGYSVSESGDQVTITIDQQS